MLSKHIILIYDYWLSILGTTSYTVMRLLNEDELENGDRLIQKTSLPRDLQ